MFRYQPDSESERSSQHDETSPSEPSSRSPQDSGSAASPQHAGDIPPEPTRPPPSPPVSSSDGSAGPDEDSNNVEDPVHEREGREVLFQESSEVLPHESSEVLPQESGEVRSQEDSGVWSQGGSDVRSQESSEARFLESNEAQSRDGTTSTSSGSGESSTNESSETSTSDPDPESPSDAKNRTRCRALARTLHAKICALHWTETNIPPTLVRSGVLIRKRARSYIVEPKTTDPRLVAAVANINAAVAIALSTADLDPVFDTISDSESLAFRDGAQIQVYASLEAVAGAAGIRRSQCAALVCKERVLVVWEQEVEKVLAKALEVSERICALVEGTGKKVDDDSLSFASSDSAVSWEKKGGEPYDGGTCGEKDVVDMSENDSLSRPVVFTSAIFVALGAFLMFCLVFGFGNRALMEQIVDDDFYSRLGLVLSEPVFFCLGLFFVIVVFNNCFQLCGPMTSMTMNSRFYSAVKPDVEYARALGFRPPPITIQMPIYTESLEGVIKPTVASLQAAISHYESIGGTARIFINDDGMALRSEADNALFEAFYANNHIGWVARPGHNFNGFLRAGKFKKASNMNYALNIATRVEAVLQDALGALCERGIETTEEQAAQLYDTALAHVLRSDPRARAGGNIRTGAVVLLVDSDTQVPTDCLLHGAAELFLAPEVAIIQHNTSVLQVSWDWFENGITYLTNLVYSSIRFAIGSGETAPFVGHNAFLRWRAVQDVAPPPDADGYTRFWSEHNVSEDFDMALRLQIRGYIVRLASYHGGAFKEGISLTIFAELDRWEKYAYGCSELVFHPFHEWLRRGPITPLFRAFLASQLQLSSKLTIVGYVSSYYALASAVPLGTLNYFLIGWKNGRLDQFYVESWKVFIALLAVFNVLSNICLAVMRYRLRERALLAALLENFKWMPFFMVFFGGLPLHLLYAISAHMLGIEMTWGSTAKEKQKDSFWTEAPRIWRRFRGTFALMGAMAAVMVYLGAFADEGLRIRGITSCVPMAVTVAMHILFPLVLNPGLMVFNY